MTEQSSEQGGQTRPAGEGVGDEEFVRQVQGQTSSDLEVEEKFEAEADGATSDTEAAKDPESVGQQP
ncbi:MAG TPA: hypothetical protein VMZ11_07205 [Mycobacteriales bacterium]|nr:hypothetical protein [Mycobacteriales bacterium]